jgi:hypothetical protein
LDSKREITEEELRKTTKPREDAVPSEEIIAQWAKEAGFDIETVRDACLKLIIPMPGRG